MNNKKGFTLLELVIVIAIIGVLVLLAAPKYLNHVEEAKDVHIVSDTRTLENELKSQLAYKNTEYKQKEVVDKDSLEDKKIYSSRGKQVEEITEPVYKIEKPKDYTNTVLTGTFFANKEGTVYYTPEEVDTKPEDTPNTGKPEQPEEPKIPNGLYRMNRFNGESELSLENVYGRKAEGKLNFDYLDLVMVLNDGKTQTLLIDHSDIIDYPIVKIVEAKGYDFTLEDSQGNQKTYSYHSPTGHIPGGFINFKNQIIQFRANGDEIEYISILDNNTALEGELK
jgi:hypothetical protein